VRVDRPGSHAGAGQYRDEAQDVVLAAARAAAAEHGIWVALGSLAIDRAGEEGADERYANRTFIIDDKGGIAARYDKMHMFDVDLATGERWRESAAYAPGRARWWSRRRWAVWGWRSAMTCASRPCSRHWAKRNAM
jgi:predicted amidohydrolase